MLTFLVYGLAAGAAQNSQNGCVLPEYPPHGTYTVDYWPKAVPGESYNFASLTVICDPGYGVVGSNTTYCFGKNAWKHPMPRCIRFCRLTPDPSVNYSCKVTVEGTILSGTRVCHELEPNGTVVVPECNSPAYYSSGVLFNMHCVDGIWDHVAVCQPGCGRSIPIGERLITNGTSTKHGEFPWHAGIYSKSYTPFMQICGGSLISTKAVISAAHCFWKDGEGVQPASKYAVALGKIYRPWDDVMDTGAHKSDVSEIKIPDRYFGHAGRDQEDIALVIMSAPVVYTAFIQPVCVNFNVEFDMNQLQSSNSGRVSGWGLTTADGLASQVLLTADLPYVDVNKCISGLPIDFLPYVTSDKICAGDKNGTALCQGDSGGGLVFPSMERGIRRYYLRGVASTAPKNGHECNANTYTTFTHIQAHATFIKDYGLGVVSTRAGQDSCVLPEYPAHGTYTVYDNPEAWPGQTINLAILTVTCDPGYGVVGNNSTHCTSGNGWLAPMPQCVRFCKLTPDPSVKYFCKVTGDGLLSGTRMCRDLEPDGTVVVPECNRPVYYSRSVLLNMRCVEGSWDHVAVCQPECGTPTSNGEPLIYNGIRTQRGELPWHAGIYEKSFTPLMQICGGSLISTKVVISAAQCFWTGEQRLLPASRYAVALGKIYRPWNEVMDPGAHKSDVSQIKIPRTYMGGDGRYHDDIALVFMSTPVVYTTFIRPVCVNFDIEFDRNQLQSTNSGKISGWGLTSADGSASQVLLTAELPYVDIATCMADMPLDFRPYISSEKFCAGIKNGTAVCRGDAGGGLVFPSVERGILRYYLRGVMSLALRNEHKCNVDTYSVYTHILPHATFITDHVPIFVTFI